MSRGQHDVCKHRNAILPRSRSRSPYLSKGSKYTACGENLECVWAQQYSATLKIKDKSDTLGNVYSSFFFFLREQESKTVGEIAINLVFRISKCQRESTIGDTQDDTFARKYTFTNV